MPSRDRRPPLRTLAPRLAGIVLLSLVGGSVACQSGPAGATPWQRVDARALAGRWGHVSVWDAARDRVLVFGGENSGGQLSELWALDLATQTWSLVPTTNPPAPRTDLAGVIDPLGQRLIIVGGRQGLATSINEVWALDLKSSAWSLLPVGPPARHDVPIATDGTRAWIFGGAGELFQSLDDLWELDFATNDWHLLPAAGELPSARTSSAMGFGSGGVYLNGGHDVWRAYNDAYRFDLAQQAWSRLSPTGGAAASAHFGYALDPVCGAIYLAGGDNLDNVDVAFTDALVFGPPPRYARLPTSALPPPRDHASLVLDGMRRALILYGGGSLGDGLGTRADAWRYPLGACP